MAGQDQGDGGPAPFIDVEELEELPLTGALHCARYDNPNDLRLLIEQTPNVCYAALNGGQNLAGIAAAYESMGVLRLLLELAPDALWVRQPNEETAAHSAAFFGRVAALRFLHAVPPVEALMHPATMATWRQANLLSQTTHDGLTPAHYAAQQDQEEALHALAELVPWTLSAMAQWDRGTPAHAAGLSGRLRSMRVLHEYVPDTLFQPNRWGAKPIDNARQELMHVPGARSVVEYLSAPWTAAQWAAIERRFRDLERMARQGADLTAPTFHENEWHTALSLALVPQPTLYALRPVCAATVRALAPPPWSEANHRPFYDRRFRYGVFKLLLVELRHRRQPGLGWNLPKDAWLRIFGHLPFEWGPKRTQEEEMRRVAVARTERMRLLALAARGRA